MSPKRIHLSREKGWRIPANSVRVDRKSKRWGNPFAKRIRGGEGGLATMTREMLCDEYRHWLTTPTYLNRTREGEWVQMNMASYPNYLGVPFEGRPSISEIRSELAGKDLACDCQISQPCHAEVLLEIANGTDA